MFMFYIQTMFKIPNLNGSLFIAAKQKAEEVSRTTDKLLFYILQKKVTVTNVVYFPIIHCPT
jgi:hypothetical protein